jgi:hypothetical protein
MLANRKKIVYAFNRYPISVSHTVLVQAIKSRAGRGKERLVTSAKIWTWRITNLIIKEVPS